MTVNKKALINEDIGYSSDATTLRVKSNVKKGNKAPSKMGQIILRRPTADEIRKAGTNPGDISMGQLRVFSKILYDFGLTSRIYRSKVTTVVFNTSKKLDKYRQIFKKFIGFFDPEEPVENVRAILELGKDDVFTCNDLLRVLRDTENWQSDSELLMNLSSVYKDIEMYDNKDKEPTDKDVKKVRDVYNKLTSFVIAELKAGHDKKTINDMIAYANSINNLMEDDAMDGATKLVYSDKAISTVSDLDAEVSEYMDSSKREGKLGQSNNLMHEEARENLQKLSFQLKNDGYTGGLTTTNVFDYLKANEPERIKYISQEYGIPEKDLSGEHFPTWESLAQFFYTPEMIRKIEFEQLQVKQRARTSGEARMGAALTNDARRLASQKRTIEKRRQRRMNGVSIDDLKARLKEKEEKLAQLRQDRDGLKRERDEAAALEDKETVDELEKSIKAAAEVYDRMASTVYVLRNKIKNYKDDSSYEVLDQADVEEIKKKDEELAAVINKAKDELDDTVGAEEFEKTLKKIDDELSSDKISDAGREKIYTWSFEINTTNSRVVRYVLNKLTAAMNMYKQYINVDFYDSSTKNSVGTTFTVDYAQSTMLYKTLEKNPGFAYQMMDALMQNVRDDLKIQASYDESSVEINEFFYESSN